MLGDFKNVFNEEITVFPSGYFKYVHISCALLLPAKKGFHARNYVFTGKKILLVGMEFTSKQGAGPDRGKPFEFCLGNQACSEISLPYLRSLNTDRRRHQYQSVTNFM